MRSAFYALTLCALASCSPYDDYQGVSPAAYEAYNPKVNTVETLADSHLVYFSGGRNTLSDDARAGLREFFAHFSPDSVVKADISMRVSNDARGTYLLRELRRFGLPKKVVRFTVSPDVPVNAAEINVTYTVVSLPDCPDWHKSGKVNYSNTLHSNARCATTTNLGMMVADPRDLEGSSGRVNPDPYRASVVIQKYQTDLTFGTATTGGISGTGQ